jgi:hypothetical protein
VKRIASLLRCVAADIGVGGAALYNPDQPEQALANMATIQGDAVFLLKDFVRYCENDKISRLWRDLAEGFRTARRSIVLLATTIELPTELPKTPLSRGRDPLLQLRVYWELVGLVVAKSAVFLL